MYSQVYLWLSLELWTREWPKEGGVPVLAMSHNMSNMNSTVQETEWR